MSRLARWLDYGAARYTGMVRFFQGGWGDLDLILRLAALARRPQPAREIGLHFGPARRVGIAGHYLFDGHFQSPDQSLPLPRNTRTAYVQLLLPRDAFKGGRAPAIALQLAGTGDEGFIGRRLMHQPLLDRGIGAMILQNPYYGKRRPEGQRRVSLRYVSDQLLMNTTTYIEASALLKWLEDDGYDRLGVTGYSMGGFMTALVAQRSERALAAIPIATGHDPSAALVKSPLNVIIDWKMLAEQMGAEPEQARARMIELFSAFDLREQGIPTEPKAAIIVGATDDVFVPCEDVETLHQHWRGSELRWMEGASHTSGWIRHLRLIRDSIEDAFERLPS